MGFAACAIFQVDTKNSAFLKMTEKLRFAFNTLSIQQIRKQQDFDRGRPSKAILLEQKNKENVLSNHLFSANL